MQQSLTYPLLAGITSVLLSVLLTYGVRGVARRRGWLAKPKSDRWHQRPTAMMGGVAIFLTVLFVYAAFAEISTESLLIMAGSSFLFLVGLLDDVLNIKPYHKLIGQMIAASIIVGFGLKLPLTGYELIDIWITVFWLIGITNAINLLDNMDGLAAGIALIAAVFLAAGFAFNGQISELTFVTIFIGALIGFLLFNFYPASIFMGDCGSMFVGFLLASSVLLGQQGGRSRGVVSILAVPVLILFVPIFDTTFVTILRKLWGRKASQGGRDHTSHRLVALGLSERAAVLMIYGFAICAGVLSLLVGQMQSIRSIALIGVFTVVLAIIGVYLAKVKVYERSETALASSENAVFAFLVNVSYKRRIFEVFLDAFLITVAYYSAYALLFDSFEDSANWTLFLETLPLLIVLKLGAFLAAGVYRGIWRYTSIADLLVFSKGVILGSILSVVAILLIYRFQNFSRAVFILDGILLLMGVVGSRLAFRLIREVLPQQGGVDGRRVLIYGAGDGGEMVLRELRNNPQLNYRAVGFIDDDPLKKDKLINGLKVFGTNGDLAQVCDEKDIREILISTRSLSAESLAQVRELSRNSGISLKRAYIKIEPMEFE